MMYSIYVSVLHQRGRIKRSKIISSCKVSKPLAQVLNFTFGSLNNSDQEIQSSLFAEENGVLLLLNNALISGSFISMQI